MEDAAQCRSRAVFPSRASGLGSPPRTNASLSSDTDGRRPRLRDGPLICVGGAPAACDGRPVLMRTGRQSPVMWNRESERTNERSRAN